MINLWFILLFHAKTDSIILKKIFKFIKKKYFNREKDKELNTTKI